MQTMDYEEAKERFERLRKRHQDKYPAFIKSVRSKREHKLCFLKYPEEIRKHIYTTNAAESLVAG